MNGKRKIIPCLDVADGKVVKGIKFENLRDAGDPAETAKYYSDNMADEITMLDIKATIEGRQIFIEMIKKVSKNVAVPFAVGGGIRSIGDIEAVLSAGANKVGINTAAVKDKNLISEAAKKFGSEAVVLAVDVKKIAQNQYNVLINAGKTDTGIDALGWALECEKLGAGSVLLTSIDTDGMKQGYDIELYKLFSDALTIPVTASGGCGKKEDILGVFQKTNVESALAASVFHFGDIKIPELKKYLSENGINVRL